MISDLVHQRDIDIKGIFQPFELERQTILIRSAVKH
jgi:hypothetical protein